ncbi:GGDEF domain-containing protein [Sulfurospirillum sp. MES]|nr:GGDEF domain-containing protein [Sulfurospirillum sp. MES]
MEQEHILDAINIDKSELYMSDIQDIVKDKKKFEHFLEKNKDEFFSLILLTLTHKSFDEDEAKDLFEAILNHKQKLNDTLQRDVGISVATLDYLQNIQKILLFPIIIEESIANFLAESTAKDGLTNLYTRDVLEVFLEKEIGTAKRKKSYVSFAMMDIDDFKEVNDTYGHQKGDEVLKTIGNILNQNIREMDLAARYGGEELSVVMPNTKVEEAYEIANRIRKAIESLHFDDFTVTVSIGISQSTRACSSKTLISLADKALYKAKENGKNQVIVHQ